MLDPDPASEQTRLLVPGIGAQFKEPRVVVGGSATADVVVDVPVVWFTGLPGTQVMGPFAARMGALIGVVVVVVVVVIT